MAAGVRVFFINLSTRPDRLRSIEHQLRECPWPWTRIDAVPKSLGSLGCTLSHIKALEVFYETTDADFGIILEDDFFWAKESDVEPFTLIREMMKETWDVVLLSQCGAKLEGDVSSNLCRCLRSTTSSGYIIRRAYVPCLLQNLKNGAVLLEKSQNPKFHAMDVFWGSLQSEHRWFATVPRLGAQIPSYSDIEHKFVRYGV